MENMISKFQINLVKIINNKKYNKFRAQWDIAA